MKRFNIAVIGATGAVGKEVFRLLGERKFPTGGIRAFGRSAPRGTRWVHYGSGEHIDTPVGNLEDENFDFRGFDYAIFSAGSEVSWKWAPIAQKAGCVVIDNSSAFRLRDDVPLVIPEINGNALRSHTGIIANPNCTTAITLMALWPLHKRYKVKRIFASSYQAVSGTGAKAIDELEQQVNQIVRGEAVTKSVYPHQIAFNVIPQVDSFDFSSGYTKEELKLQNEGRKIMSHPDFLASVTCVRVPVKRSHAVAVSAEFESQVPVDQARKFLQQAPGIDVIDNPLKNEYPTPLDVAGKENCQVGRIRRDSALGENGLAFWVVGDQLLKGAALNAVQILEELTNGHS